MLATDKFSGFKCNFRAYKGPCMDKLVTSLGCSLLVPCGRLLPGRWILPVTIVLTGTFSKLSPTVATLSRVLFRLKLKLLSLLIRLLEI